MTIPYSDVIRNEVLQAYNDGHSILGLCKKYKIARTTLYRWLKDYVKQDVDKVEKISKREIYQLRKEVARLRIENRIFKECKCSLSSPLNEKLVAMEKVKDKFSVHSLSRTLNVNRSTFYHHLLRRPAKKQWEQEDENLRPLIKKVFYESKERFGARKIRAKLMADGITISNKRIFRLMSEMKLICKQSRLRYFSTSNRKYKYYRNKLQQDFSQPEPNLVWSSDVTYIRVKDQFYSLCVIIDLFSRKVISYGISQNNDTELIQSTFDKAFASRGKPADLMFHSDQGVQYTSFDFRKHLRKLDVKQSFSNPGMPLDNAVSESFFATMKREELSHNFYEREDDLFRDVEEYVDFFNNCRPHQKLGFRTPVEVERDFSDMTKEKRVFQSVA